jgi:hypothetical protein
MLGEMSAEKTGSAVRASDDLLLESAYRSEFRPKPTEEDSVIDGKRVRVNELRAMAINDLCERITSHKLLLRIDDTARLEALRFVERRFSESDKIGAYDASGSFAGFLKRVIHNLLLDWLRSPAGRHEVHRLEHDGQEGSSWESAYEHELPMEVFAKRKQQFIYNVLAMRTIASMPPGRGVILRLSLWPAYEHDEKDVQTISGFAHCHESSEGQGQSRACDSGKRCTSPTESWSAAYQAELEQAKLAEPQGLSRRMIAELTRIGHGKPLAKREGAICERVSKARMQLVEQLRRSGIRGAEG